MSDPVLREEIKAAMASCKRVDAILAASPDGYQPPEDPEKVSGE